MLDEYNALITSRMWVLMPHPTNVDVVRSLWLFIPKFHADGSLSRYKARLVANGRSQQQGIDCDETFNLVVKPDTIRTVLNLAVSRDWLIHQLDVKNDFLHSHLFETVYMHQPPRFVDSVRPDYSKFAKGILKRAHIQHCNPCRIPVNTESKIRPEGDHVVDPTLYRSLDGRILLYVRGTLDLSYVVQHVCLYMHDHRKPHLLALKRILRYVRGTLDHGLQLHASSMTRLVAYTDADCVEAEYHRIANVIAEMASIRNLLRESHTPLFTATLVYCDNVSAIYLSTNPVQHKRTKHIEIDVHSVYDYVASGEVRVLNVPLRFQYVDIFTKLLPTTLFLKFRSTLKV
ncbi:ribonuclease H-like domain-containing protein [Tanacetum coccineum]|uniref:Ribonuclease H-like domain-containing protein n=1 Tax=Tanacetum coccineum TaxID=301880 RepID=A0ABQ5HDQ6_9ASTR